jgi:hypothetical protein
VRCKGRGALACDMVKRIRSEGATCKAHGRRRLEKQGRSVGMMTTDASVQDGRTVGAPGVAEMQLFRRALEAFRLDGPDRTASCYTIQLGRPNKFFYLIQGFSEYETEMLPHGACSAQPMRHGPLSKLFFLHERQTNAETDFLHRIRAVRNGERGGGSGAELVCAVAHGG